MAAQAARKLEDPNAPNNPAVELAFQAVPDTMVAEILDGVLYTAPRPGRRAAKAKSVLLVHLGMPFCRGKQGPGGWEILFEPEIHLGTKPDKVVPDLAGWRSGRLPDLLADEDAAFFDVTPDWACEILSESTVARDRVQKMNIYARERVTHVWLIHPFLRTFEVYRLQDAHYLLLGTFGGEDVVRAEPFDAIEIPLQSLWMGAPSGQRSISP